MSLQYHYTVVACEYADGVFDVYLDDGDSGIFPEGNVFDDDTDEWRYPEGGDVNGASAVDAALKGQRAFTADEWSDLYDAVDEAIVEIGHSITLEADYDGDDIARMRAKRERWEVLRSKVGAFVTADGS